MRSKPLLDQLDNRSAIIGIKILPTIFYITSTNYEEFFERRFAGSARRTIPEDSGANHNAARIARDSSRLHNPLSGYEYRTPLRGYEERPERWTEFVRKDPLGTGGRKGTGQELVPVGIRHEVEPELLLIDIDGKQVGRRPVGQKDR